MVCKPPIAHPGLANDALSKPSVSANITSNPHSIPARSCLEKSRQYSSIRNPWSLDHILLRYLPDTVPSATPPSCPQWPLHYVRLAPIHARAPCNPHTPIKLTSMAKCTTPDPPNCRNSLLRSQRPCIQPHILHAAACDNGRPQAQCTCGELEAWCKRAECASYGQFRFECGYLAT
jgi:hypothetical protein